MVDLEWPLGGASGGSAIGQADLRAPAQVDVKLFQLDDGGEIECINGVVTMDDGVATAVYLSLFGGNEDDSGTDADLSREFWGNKLTNDPSEKQRSETQHLLRSLPITSGNLRLIEEAVARDLAWMTESEVASFVGAEVSIPAINTVKILVKVEIQQVELTLEFVRKAGTQ